MREEEMRRGSAASRKKAQAMMDAKKAQAAAAAVVAAGGSAPVRAGAAGAEAAEEDDDLAQHQLRYTNNTRDYVSVVDAAYRRASKQVGCMFCPQLFALSSLLALSFCAC